VTIALVHLDAAGATRATTGPWHRVVRAAATPAGIAAAVDEVLADPTVEWVLTWSAELADPDHAVVSALAARPLDVAHAGLRLGTGGLHRWGGYVDPTWMLRADPPVDGEATSWRLHLAACLVRADVLRDLGGVDPGFRSLTGAGLELGLRLAVRGALLRHVPALVPAPPRRRLVGGVPAADELRLTRLRSGRGWTAWALMRALRNGPGRLGALRAMPALARPLDRSWPATPLARTWTDDPDPSRWHDQASALVPTVDREPYLRVVLDHLGRQSVRLREIVVVDQGEDPTLPARLEVDFAHLPLRVLRREVAGQCSARNAGLDVITAPWVLFVDDDVECDEHLVARHLQHVERYDCDASCGAILEVGAGDVAPSHRLVRVSDVFPTCNALASRQAIEEIGGFDLAYDRGPRADHDLGTRLYLSGRSLVFNPVAQLLHHHAPRGGLRTHDARVVTYAASRTDAKVRHLPEPTELYLMRRYFPPDAVREAELIREVGTLSTHGSTRTRLTGLALGVVRLPDTVRRMRTARERAAELLAVHPTIPGITHVPAAQPHAAGAADPPETVAPVSPTGS
jgi:GT2 family glycosyltransferase